VCLCLCVCPCVGIAAIGQINEALDGSDLESTLGAMQHPAAKLTDVDPSLAQHYYDLLLQARREKAHVRHSHTHTHTIHPGILSLLYTHTLSPLLMSLYIPHSRPAHSPSLTYTHTHTHTHTLPNLSC